MFAETFEKIGDEWMLIAAGDSSRCNAMTASWGGMGVLWGKRVCFVFIRPQRYTKRFVDANETFSLSFFDGGAKKELGYMGKVSGKDEDKISACGFHVTWENGAPVFQEAAHTLVCKKLYCQEMTREGFADGGEAIEKFYAANDFHFLYVGEIVKEI